jgi:hypothetical protein
MNVMQINELQHIYFNKKSNFKGKGLGFATGNRLIAWADVFRDWV